ncbi:MAG: ATP-binding cassette domain-containing protein [Crocinitomicaceae bacterium]
MKIQFDNLMPKPLAEIAHAENSIWKTGFVVEGQDRVMLNAHSGKGKTTFTHVITGIRKDYSGTCRINDQDIRTFKLKDWEKIRKFQLSVVFQDLQLFDKITVRENLLIKNRLTNHKTEAQIKERLDQFGMADKWNTKCGILSMGQQQRIAIIRSLLQPFEMMILDEPFSHLDKVNQAIGIQMFNEEADKNSAGYILTTLGEDHGNTFTNTLFL